MAVRRALTAAARSANLRLLRDGRRLALCCESNRISGDLLVDQPTVKQVAKSVSSASLNARCVCPKNYPAGRLRFRPERSPRFCGISQEGLAGMHLNDVRT